MRRIFNWMIDKWLAGFLTASFFFLVKIYVNLPAKSKENFLSFKWLSDLLETKISISIVIIIILVIIVLSRIEKAHFKSRQKKRDFSFQKEPNNPYAKYTRDTFGKSKTSWTWNYKWDRYKKVFLIINLKPVCKQCGTPMEITTFYSSNSAECHRCRLEGRNSFYQLTEFLEDIEKEIIRRIDNDEVKIVS